MNARTRFALVSLLMLSLLIFLQVYRFLTVAPAGKNATDETPQIVEIPLNATFKQATTLFSNERLITNRLYFTLLARWRGADRRIKPGEYSLNRGMLPGTILDLLESGRVVQHAVAIPEGFTARQIARMLEEGGLAQFDQIMKRVSDGDFVRSIGLDGDSLEGYLFPSTYYLRRHMKPEEILRVMTEEFVALYRREILPRSPSRPMREVVTLASIVEKETAVPAERRRIASVLLNRLKRRVPLQSDPTVIYAIPNFNGNLTREHLLIASPYNTYRFAGLPPGPIANPGLESLLAVVDPEPTDYLYFVSKNDGTHYFSRTLEEHSRAVNRYQRRRIRRTAPESRKSAAL